MNGWRYALTTAALAVAIVAIGALAGRSTSLRAPLGELPFRLAAWQGHAEPVDAVTRERTHPDQMVNRRYVDTSGHTVTLYVAYYAREGARAQVLDVCSACEVLSTGIEGIEIGRASLTVNRALTREDSAASLVLYWYQRGDTIYHDRYRQKVDQALGMLSGRGSEGALVRVTAPLVGTEQATLRWSLDFARALVPQLHTLFQN